MSFEIEGNEVTILMAVAVVTALVFSVLKPKEPFVSDIKIYHMKSCAPILEAVATPFGFENDRIAQVSDASKGNNYCIPRDKQSVKLFHVQPLIQHKDADSPSLSLHPTNQS